MEVPYFSPETDRSRIASEVPASEATERLVDLLSSEELRYEIQSGNVTLAMIRPGLEESTVEAGTKDTEIAETLEESIQGIGVLAKFAVVFDRQAINEFYEGGPKEVQLPKAPERKSEFGNRWEELEALMTSGPTTILLLTAQEPLFPERHEDTIDIWRQQLGHWDVVSHRDPDTLRGKFTSGEDNYNNLFHGSDSPEAAEKELDIILRCISRQQEAPS